MAITFITGVARSGKSYFSTYNLYQMYKPELKKINLVMQWFRFYIKPLPPKKMYDYVYTNINQFNFDFHPNIKKLDFDNLVEKLTILHELHVKNKASDDELLIKCREFKLDNALFVIDEAAHVLKKPVNGVVLWWLSYHGHLFQDIHLISQHLDMIPKEYIVNGEYFYIAYPPSSAIFKNRLNYGNYKNAKFYKNGKLKDFSIPLNPNVFKLYVSGKLPERKPILKKFIPIFVLLFAFLYFTISNFFSTNDEQILKNNPDYHKSENIKSPRLDKDIHSGQTTDENINVNLEDKSLLNFGCINEICKSKNYKNIPLSFLLFLFKNEVLDYIDSKKVTYQYTIYSVLLSKESVDLLNRSFLIETTKKSKKLNKQSTKLF